jgi:hypothetical protein
MKNKVALAFFILSGLAFFSSCTAPGTNDAKTDFEKPDSLPEIRMEAPLAINFSVLIEKLKEATVRKKFFGDGKDFVFHSSSADINKLGNYTKQNLTGSFPELLVMPVKTGRMSEGILEIKLSDYSITIPEQSARRGEYTAHKGINNLALFSAYISAVDTVNNQLGDTILYSSKLTDSPEKGIGNTVKCNIDYHYQLALFDEDGLLKNTAEVNVPFEAWVIIPRQ